MPKIRVGIDVGGTFTHAVAVSSDTLEIVGDSKVLTTHNAPNGVAQGVVESLKSLIKSSSIKPQDVTFIAHSTTQATNALLEGDVSKVGIIGMGSGLEKLRAEGEANIRNIQLADGKHLETSYGFLDLTKGLDKCRAEGFLKDFLRERCGAAAISHAFSPDDPHFENTLKSMSSEIGLPAVASSEISGLYGLRVRTRTAALNASILPMMMKVGEDVEKSIKEAGISAPLMVMRSDGGVISMPEVKRRPIQTILSGPAAGIAGALMYSKVSDAIFLDVGGTSTDISVILDGRAKVKSAEIGGHKLYLKTLDVRTAGLAGGSMVRVKDGKIVDVGPRSAHIASLPYACFSKEEELNDLEIVTIAPKKDDPADHVAVRSKQDKSFAITITCAANALSLVKESDYAFGRREAARKALEPLAEKLGSSVDEVAENILDIGSKKLIFEISRLIKDYKLDKGSIVLVGGGGAAGALVPYLAKKMKVEFKVTPNHAIISAIGVALALVHDVVERTIVDPGEKDILEVRRLAEESVIHMGAKKENIEVKVEIEAKKNIVRASATGATELKLKERGTTLDDGQIRNIAAKSMKLDAQSVKLLGATGFYYVFGGQTEEKALFGIIRTKRNPIRILDSEGVVRLKRNDGLGFVSGVKRAAEDLKNFISRHSSYGDAGERVPHIFALCRGQFIDLSGIPDFEGMRSVLALELKKCKDNDRVIFVSSHE